MSKEHKVYTGEIDESDGTEVGNSAAVEIPASVMAAMHLDLDEVVDVIEPVRPKTYDLDDLLKGITRTNLHEPIGLIVDAASCAGAAADADRARHERWLGRR